MGNRLNDFDLTSYSYPYHTKSSTMTIGLARLPLPSLTPPPFFPAPSPSEEGLQPLPRALSLRQSFHFFPSSNLPKPKVFKNFTKKCNTIEILYLCLLMSTVRRFLIFLCHCKKKRTLVRKYFVESNATTSNATHRSRRF